MKVDEAKKWSSALPLEHELSTSEYEPLIRRAFSTLSLEIWRLLREAQTRHITPSKFR